jgi:CRP-like cAMP-binding protein
MTTSPKPGKATPAAAISPTPGLDRLIERDPDIVDRMFDYLLQQMPELAGRAGELAKAERALRTEFRRHRGLHVRSPKSDETAEIRAKVQAYPIGTSKNAIARDLGISRMTVYRILAAAGVSAPPVL